MSVVVRAIARLGLLTRADLELDLAIEQHLPAPHLIISAIALATLVAIAWLSRTGEHVYSESVAFVVAALVAGILVPVWSVVIVLSAALAELATAMWRARVLTGLDLAGAIGGRAVAIWLLWLLVIRIPVMSRAAARQALASRVRSRTLRIALALTMASATAALFAYIWTEAVPRLILPAFVWTHMSVPPAASAAVQSQAPLIVIVAAVAALLAAIPLAFSRAPRSAIPSRGRIAAAFGAAMGWVVRPVVLTAAMGGLISSWPQAAVVWACFLLVPLAGRLAQRRLGFARLAAPVPIPIRIALAFGVVFGLAAGAEFLLLWAGHPSVPRVSLLPGLVVGMFVFAMFSPPSPQRAAGRSRAKAGATLGRRV